MTRLIEVPFLAVAQYARGAAKEHVSITDTRKTHWYQWKGVGCCALLEISPAQARVKGVYVVPEERGMGKGTAMTLELFEIAALMGYRKLEAFALNPGFYEAAGWKRTHVKLRSGAWKVVNE